MYSLSNQFTDKPPTVPDYRGYFRYTLDCRHMRWKFYCEENNDDFFNSYDQFRSLVMDYFINNINGKFMLSMLKQGSRHHKPTYSCISKRFFSNGKMIEKDGIYEIEFYSKRTSVKSVIMDCDIPNVVVKFSYNKYGKKTFEEYFLKSEYIERRHILHNKYGPAKIKFINDDMKLMNYPHVSFYKNNSYVDMNIYNDLRKFASQLPSFKPNSIKWWEDIEKSDYEIFHLTHGYW